MSLSNLQMALRIPRARGGRISVFRPSLFLARIFASREDYFTFTYTLLIALFCLFVPHLKTEGKCQGIIRSGSTVMTFGTESALTHHWSADSALTLQNRTAEQPDERCQRRDWCDRRDIKQENQSNDRRNWNNCIFKLTRRCGPRDHPWNKFLSQDKVKSYYRIGGSPPTAATSAS